MRDFNAHRKHDRRAGDFQSAGGNAYSGSGGTVDGGDVINTADSNDDTITNTDSSECCMQINRKRILCGIGSIHSYESACTNTYCTI